MQIRPDLTENQAVAATLVLHNESERYLAKGKGASRHIMLAIYEAGLAEEDAYWGLGYMAQIELACNYPPPDELPWPAAKRSFRSVAEVYI